MIKKQIIKNINNITRRIIQRFFVLGFFVFLFFGQTTGDNFLTISKADAANITISGTLYKEDLNYNFKDSGKTIKIAVGTSTPSIHSTTTDSSGNWSITNISNTNLSSTTPFTVWLDGDDLEATTMLMGYSGSNIAGIFLVIGMVTVDSPSGARVLSHPFSFYDSDNDDDILYNVTSATTTIFSNLSLRSGYFSLPTTTLEVRGDMLNHGSTLEHNNGTLYINNSKSEITSFLLGKDASASATGTGSSIVQTFAVNGNYLYVGKANNSTACSQVVGSAIGCELQIYDISSTTNPIYIAGLDVDGSSTGTGSSTINTIKVVGKYLYIGKDPDSTACSQSAGSAIGCELQVYDVSSTTNPIYKAGRDSNGSSVGTSSIAVRSISLDYYTGNYLYVTKFGDGTACSEAVGGAIGCELLVFDVSSSTNPTMVAARNSTGQNSGTTNSSYLSSRIYEDYLFIGKNGNGTACSQTAGSGANGCELQVYDISSTTNPTYVAGRDVDGSETGTSSATINSIFFSNHIDGKNFLFIGKVGNATDCNGSIGFATGCEVMAFDVTTSTSPNLLWGIDSDGSYTGTSSVTVNSVMAEGTYLYVSKGANGTACSQTVGLALGCELQIYDTHNNGYLPSYLAGMDSDGSATGTIASQTNGMVFVDGYLYIGKGASNAACNQNGGSASGCELQIYKATSVSEYSDNSSLNNILIDGYVSGIAMGTTSSLTIDNNTNFGAPFNVPLKVSGNFTNRGNFLHKEGTVKLVGTNQSLISTATTTFFNFTKSITSVDTLNFTAGQSYIVEGNLTLNGTTSNRLSLRSSVSGSQWNIKPEGTLTISYLDVKDSNNIDPTTITCNNSCINSGNNTNWSIIASYAIISGTLYSDAGITNAGSGKTIKIAIGTSTPSIHSTTTNSSGNWSITNINDVNLSSTTPFTVWLDGNVNDAVTLISGYSGGNITSVPVYYGYTIINTNNIDDNLEIKDFYDSSDDADILYTLTSTSTVLNANLLINKGVFNAPTSTLVISGNFKNNSTFNANNGEVFLTGSGKTIDGILKATSTFYNLKISGSYTFATTSASTTNLLIMSGGTLVAPNNLTILGNFTNQGTFTNNNGNIYVNNVNDEIVSYVAGMDSRGLPNDVGVIAIEELAVKDNFLFVGKASNVAVCSQTAGSAIGCELQVYDISSTTNPTYVAGRDISGSVSGSVGLNVFSLLVKGNYLYVGKAGSSTACSQTAGSAEGCELQVYDISSTTNPTYVAGRDTNGSATGADSNGFNYMTVNGNFLYVVKDNNSTACSQTAGSAIGCELMVFDISSSTNPTYVAGRDVKGDSVGTGNTMMETVVSSGNYLFVGKGGAATACSQTAGSAIGCELMVFDISSSTNPTYVAGRDVSGNSNGVGSSYINELFINDTYLYVAKDGDATACSQTAGSAIGCELQVYDISSTTNPTYVAGRDVSGNSNGVESVTFTSLALDNNYLYAARDISDCTTVSDCGVIAFNISSSTNPVSMFEVNMSGTLGGSTFDGTNDVIVYEGYFITAKDGDATACSQTAGSAIGCEFMIFSAPTGVLLGDLTGSSSLANIYAVDGAVYISNSASTTNITIATTSNFTAPPNLTISGNLNNYGDYNHSSGTVILSGSNQSIVSPATTTFYGLTKSVTASSTLTFTAGGTYKFNGPLNLNGAVGNLLSLRSSSSTGQWKIDSQATTSLSYLDVQDSNNINVTTITCSTGCIDGGRNTNWQFGDIASLVSNNDYHFYVGQATTTLDQITITKLSSGSTDITTTNDLRIRIATTTTNFRFNTSTTNLTFGGTASSKVSNTVSYENSGAVLVINVTTNFSQGDTLTINGLNVGSFSSVAATTSRLSLYNSGSINGVPATEDSKVIHLTGSIVSDNHSLGQEDNKFDFQNKNDEALFTFSLTANNENATVTDMVFTLSGIQGITSGEVTDLRLYRDNNNNAVVGGGDTLIDGAGIMTINGQHGAITFSSDFLATSSAASYILSADLNSIDREDALLISLPTSGITSIGSTSQYTSVVVGSPNSAQHLRNGATGGGSSARIGGDAPAGNGNVSGGGQSGGQGADKVNDGANIAADVNFMRPTATGDVHNEWSNPSNALLSDGTYATAGSNGLRQSYNGFNFGIPSGNTIQGLAVKLDASGSTASGTIDVSISWNGGSSYTTAKATPTLSGSDIVYTVGGSSDTWGRSWISTEFNPSNFRIRVTAVPSSNTIRLDGLEIRIYHQTGGGSAGGGGGI